MTARDILDFWFSDRVKALWFNSTAEFDREITQRFEDLVVKAGAGELDHWQQTPEGCISLIILLDQLPLNMYRGKPGSFSYEDKALDVVRQGLASNIDQSLSDTMRTFFYMPLMHSESLADQDLAIQLYEESGLESNLRFAKHHRELIQRFGRFPHRNAILGRVSTPEEMAYLDSPEAFLG